MIERHPIDGREWLELVTSMPEALPFHHPAWAAMIARCYGFDVFALALRQGDELVAGVPVVELPSPFTRRRRWSSLPFTDICPPLVGRRDADRFALAIDVYRQAHDVAELEISGAFPSVPSVASPRHVQHLLTLDADPDAVARRFRPAVRRNVRAARSGDLRLRRAGSESDMVDVFYGLQVSTRRRLGLPPQPRRFFRALWRDVLEPGLGHLTVVEARGEPVAAGVFLTWNGVTVYKYGASDPAAWSLRPNNLLFAEEIEAACVRGDRVFHFGRTDVADDGLRRFKTGWGADELPLSYVRFGAPRIERAGPPEAFRSIVRRTPEPVVRLLGETFYRYVA